MSRAHAHAPTLTYAPTLAGIGAYITIKQDAHLLDMNVWGMYCTVRRYRVPKVKLGNTVLLKASDVHLVRN